MGYAICSKCYQISHSSNVDAPRATRKAHKGSPTVLVCPVCRAKLRGGSNIRLSMPSLEQAARRLVVRALDEYEAANSYNTPSAFEFRQMLDDALASIPPSKTGCYDICHGCNKAFEEGSPLWVKSKGVSIGNYCLKCLAARRRGQRVTHKCREPSASYVAGGPQDERLKQIIK